MSYEPRFVIYKIGTEALRKEGTLNEIDESVIKGIVNVIGETLEYSRYPVLLSSGARLKGMEIKGIEEVPDMSPEGVTQSQYLCGVGQAALTELYGKYLRKIGLTPMQALLTHEILKDKDHRKDLIKVIKHCYEQGGVAIVNENDIVNSEELRSKKRGRKFYFDDNDELAFLIAKELNAEMCMFFNKKGGLYGENKKIISRVTTSYYDETIEMVKSRNGSNYGRGGIASKVNMACNCAKNGIIGAIANSKYLIDKDFPIFELASDPLDKDVTIFFR